jgi:hypothetical protein
MPSDSAAIPIRPASRVLRKLMNPYPSLPSTFSLGTTASSKISSRVSLARQPILSCFFPALTPRVLGKSGAWPTPSSLAFSKSVVSLVTMKLVIPLFPLPASVRAVTTKISPTPAWVMKILEPLSK